MTGVDASMRVDEIIRILDLSPHPEGGHYCEMFRDDGVEGERAASTAIYYLLASGEMSRWHRVDAVEIWHFYAGSPLALTISENGVDRSGFRLGIDLAAGERPQVIVPRYGWQMAESLGAWTLVGCTVAPGFEFSGFEMAPDDWQPGSQ